MSKPLSQVAAEQIRAELAIQRVTGSELARRLKVSHAYVSRRLNGETPFDLRELEQVAEVLGVPASRFLPTDQTTAAAS